MDKMRLVVKKRWWIILAVLGIVVGSGIFLNRTGPEARSYRGKSIKAWALQLSTASPQSRAEAAAAFKGLGTNAVPGLVRLLEARDSLWRQAIWRLAPRLPRRARQAISQNIHTAVGIRMAAAQSLRVLGPEAQAAVPALAKALREDEARVRWEAAGALGSIGGSARAELGTALTAKDPSVRRAAAYGLGETDLKEVDFSWALMRALGDEHPAVRIAAAASMAKLGTNVLPVVLEACTSRDRRTRQCAVTALEVLRPAHDISVPVLVEMAHDKDPAFRALAMQTLTMLGWPDRKMIDAFKDGLADPTVEVRLAAVRGLGLAPWQAKSVVPALTESLNDTSPQVRESAARALGTMGVGAKPALAELARLAQDKEEPVRAAAKEAAARIESLEPAKSQP